MEVINIRCFDQDIDKVLQKVIGPILKSEDVKRTMDITVYKHAEIAMELVISIADKLQSENETKSDFGFRMANILKSFGIVNHVIWNKIKI